MIEIEKPNIITTDLSEDGSKGEFIIVKMKGDVKNGLLE